MIDTKHLDRVAAHVMKILPAEREALGFSMNFVAERSGLSQSMVSRVEKQARMPTLATLLRITTALEVDLADVLARAQKAALHGPPR